MARRIRRDLGIFIPSVGAQLITTTSLFLTPLIIGALVTKARLDETAAGSIFTVELVASALTTLAVSAWGRPVSLRRAALWGGAIALLGGALTLLSPNYYFLIAVRLLAGLGAGIVAAAAASILPRSFNAERLISVLTFVGIVNGATWLFILPYAVDWLGYRGPYACLIFINLGGLLLLTRLPSPPVRQARVGSAAIGGWPMAGLPVVAAMFLTQLGQGSFWALNEEFGLRAGLEAHTIGTFLSLATLLLLVGVVFTAFAGQRLGRYLPLFVFTAVNAMAILVIAAIPDPTFYVWANVVQAVTNLASVIYQLGIAASLDRSGRVIAAASGVLGLGNGIGPSVATYLDATLGAANVGWFVLMLNIVALLLYALAGARRLPAINSLDPERPAAE
jgi:MFS family permease